MFFANKVRDELQKLLGKDYGTLRLQKREEQFPIVQNRRVMSYVKADVYDLHLDPPANPEKCINTSRYIYNILKIVIDAEIRYRIARITNLYDNAFVDLSSHTVYINSRIDENRFYLPTISSKVFDPHLMLPQSQYMMLPWSVLLWHELVGHAYLNIGRPCIQTNFRSEWEILTGDLIKQQKYDQAMKLCGPFGTKIDPVIYYENIARKALLENGYYPNMKGRCRHLSYFSNRPTRVQRAQFPTHQQPNNRLPCQ